ncbi:MAG: IclR family transcriptional regulator [Bacillota bacterium]|nr:IclR family transcriptional regulator [Bacillota bacterium]
MTEHQAPDREALSGQKPYFLLQSVDRALAVLELFSERTPELGLREMSEPLGLHKSVVHRLVTTLEVRGFLERDRTSGRWRIGPRMFELGELFLSDYGIEGLTHELERLAERAGLSAHLAILDKGEVLYIRNVEKRSELGFVFHARVGQRAPVHTTALGKCLVAWLPTEEVQQIIVSHGLPRRTAATITDPERFLEHLAQVREQGYAFDLEESAPGISCLGAPIRNVAGRVVAAVSVTAATAEAESGYLAQLVPAVLETAKRMSMRLGHRLGLR